MTLGLLLVVGEPPSAGSTTLVAIVALVLSGSLFTSLLALWRQHKMGGNERDTLIADATSTAVAAAQTMLKEYRIELAEAKVAILELRQQLAEAGTRIARLERDLMTANGDRERLERALSSALERRARMTTELDGLRGRVADLEGLVK
jgi:chromosome segregation ATPase